MNTIESYIDNYKSFMEQSIYQQKQMNRYIQECICLEENNYKGLEFLNEGVLDSIKETIENIIQKIKEALAKFGDTLSKTFKSDQKYLEDNKDIILTKQVTLDFNDYHEYNIQLFTTGSSIPKFAYEEMHSSGALASEDAFISKYFKSFEGKGGKSFSDHVKYILQGKEPVPTKEGKDINMKDLYNYCYEYNKLIEKLEAEQKSLSSAQAESYKIITDKSAEAAKPGETETNTQTPNTNNSQTSNESMVYSSVYNKFITESFVHEITVNGKESKSTSSTSNPASAVSNKPTDAESVVKNQKTSTGRQDEDLSKSMGGTDVETLKSEINVYFTTCGTMLTTKIIVAQEIFKEYMFIIREHIRSIVGTKDSKSSNKGVDMPSTFVQLPNDNIRSKLNQSEIDEYETLFNAFNNKWTSYWAKSPKGVQYYRTDPTSGQNGWVKSTDVNADLDKANKAFMANADAKQTFDELRKFLDDKGITDEVVQSQKDSNLGENGPKDKEEKEKK